jgi:hypothetical protein
MFSKLILIATAALAGVAVAFPVAQATPPLASCVSSFRLIKSFGLLTANFRGQCTTGAQYCCQSVQSSSTPQAQQAIASVEAQVGANIPVGLTCDAVTVIGAGSGSSW